MGHECHSDSGYFEPMAEGHDWTRPPFTKKVYQVPLVPVFAVIVVFAALLVIPVDLAKHAVLGRPWGGIDYWQLLTIPPALGVVMAPLVYWLARVDLTPDSITTSNAWGVRQKMPITDIDRAWRPWYAVGLFVIVQGRGRVFRLWVPLFLRGFEDFCACFQQVTPDTHPLHVFFKQYAQTRR